MVSVMEYRRLQILLQLLQIFSRRKKDYECVISDFRREVNEICASVGFNKTWNGNSGPTFRDNLTVATSGAKHSKTDRLRWYR